jgi:MFS family permease
MMATRRSRSLVRQPLERIDAALRQSLARYRAVAGERNLALLVGAGFLSEVGDWFNTVALISLSYHFSDGATGVGGMLAARMLTRLLVQGPAGTVADRYPGRGLLFTSQLLLALVASAFALLVLLPELWLLYLLVIVLEAVSAVARPTFMIALRTEAAEEQRAAATGALFASMTTAQLVGPALGGFVLVQFGASAVFALNGATFLGVAAAVAALPGGLRQTAAAAAGEVVPGATSGDAGVEPAPAAGGYRWLLRRHDLTLYALVSLSLALLVQATIVLFVVRANALGLTDAGVGLFFTAVACGSLVGSVVAGASVRDAASALYPAAVTMALSAAALATFGAAGSLELAIVALIVAGFTSVFDEVVALTYFQHTLPEAVYGRFFSIFLMALTAGGLAGALAAPALEPIVGVAGALTILAAPVIALALLLAHASRG